MSKSLIKFTQTSLIVALSIAATVFMLGFDSAPTADAQSGCYTEAWDVSAYDKHPVGVATVTPTDSVTVDISDYVGSDEEATRIYFDTENETNITYTSDYRVESIIRILTDGSLRDSETIIQADTINRDSYSYDLTSESIDTVEFEVTAIAENNDSNGEVESSAAVGDIRLEICPDGGNQAPTARDDGSPTRIPVEGDNQTAVDVLENDGQGGGSNIDADGDDLEITSASTDDGDTSVKRVSGNTMLSYDPTGYSGTYPLEDEITYSISDGNGGTDSATAFISVGAAGSTGKVKIKAGNSTSANLLGQGEIVINPEYTDSEQEGGNAIYASGKNLGPLDLVDAVSSGWTVKLDDTDPYYFNVTDDMISVPDGYRLNDIQLGEDEPIRKTSVTPEGDLTGLNTSAQMGPIGSSPPPPASVCTPPVPSVGACSQTTIGSAGNDKVLVSASNSGYEDQCAVEVGSQHPGYTSISGANWIWEDTEPPVPASLANAVFAQQFTLQSASDVETARVSFATDNFYKLTVNGQTVAEAARTSANDPSTTAGVDDAGYNFSTVKTVDIKIALISGTNTVKLSVTNENSSGGNPAAGIFAIDLDTRNATCSNYPTDYPPQAQAAAIPISTSGSSHTYRLDGSGSSDPEGEPLTYSWQVTEASSNGLGQLADPANASIDDPTAETTDGSFSNLQDDTIVTYTIELTVTDETGNSDTAQTTASVTCNDTGGATTCFSGGGPGGLNYH